MYPAPTVPQDWAKHVPDSSNNPATHNRQEALLKGAIIRWVNFERLTTIAPRVTRVQTACQLLAKLSLLIRLGWLFRAVAIRRRSLSSWPHFDIAATTSWQGVPTRDRHFAAPGIAQGTPLGLRNLVTRLVRQGCIQLLKQLCIFLQRVGQDFGLLPGGCPILLFDRLG